MINKSQLRVVFLDIDGTLMGKNPKALEENISIIQKVRSLGHKVLINTGRATSYMPKELNLQKDFDGVVSGAGAIVRLDGKVLFKKLMSFDIVRKACELFANSPNLSVIEGEENIYYFSEAELDRENWVRLDKNNYKNIVTPDIPVEKFTVLGTISKEISEALEKECVSIQHPTYGEIIRRDCSKASAMQVVADSLGIPMSQCVAMGDSLNDFDMIKAAGVSVAMGNAIDEIKEISDFVTDDADNVGVASALKRIFNLS